MLKVKYFLNISKNQCSLNIGFWNVRKNTDKFEKRKLNLHIEKQKFHKGKK